MGRVAGRRYGGETYPTSPNVASGFTATQLAAQQQLAWFVSPSGGSDKNDGLTRGTPVAHFAEIFRRWGTLAPDLSSVPATVVVTVMDDVPASDPWRASPFYGQEFAIAFVGSPQVLAGPAAITSYAPANYGTAGMGDGTRPNMTVAGVASWTPGTLVRSADYSLMVTRDLGGGVAEVSTAMAYPVVAGGALATPRVGDEVTLYVRPTVARPMVDYVTAGATETCTALDFTTEIIELRQQPLFYECLFSGIILANTLYLYAADLWSCYVAGVIAGPWVAVASVIAGEGSSPSAGSYFDGDTYFDLAVHFQGTDLDLAQVNIADHNNTDGGPIWILGGFSAYGPGRIWGQGTLSIGNGTAIGIVDQTAASFLLTKLLMNGNQAYSFVDGVFAPQALTPANVDTYGGLQDPLTGSRIYFVNES